MRQIQRILGLSFSSVRYNIDVLKKNGEVFGWDESGRSRLFTPAISERERVVYSHLRNRTCRTILRAIAQHGRLTNRQLLEVTGLAKSTLSERIHRLLQVEMLMITFSSDGRMAYQLKEPESLLSLLRAADQTVLEEAADRFIQLWDF